MKNRLFFVGSLPHSTPAEAIRFVSKHSSHLPFLPQLADSNPQEDMVAQVIKGIELGGWDEKCSSSLELFQNTFNESPQFKVQVAGPFTVSRTVSQPFEKLVLDWLEFSIRLMRQLRQGAFEGELWLQVDEPSWSAKNPFPKDYCRLLGSVLGGIKGLRLGVHSCATERPYLTEEIENLFKFYSFDFSKSAMGEEEGKAWDRRLESGLELAVGCLTPAGPPEEAWLRGQKGAWISAPCGLYGWSKEALASTFG